MTPEKMAFYSGVVSEQSPPEGAASIPLTKGWVAWVDMEDYPLVSSYCWHVLSAYGYAVRRRLVGEDDNSGTGKSVIMHRQIMQAIRRYDNTSCEVDHREKLCHIKVVDNRKSNLRICLHASNSKNKRKKKTKAVSVFKGVTNTRGWWQSRIMKDGQKYELGCFREEWHAALAYDVAAKRLHGEFARTNFL